MIRVQRRDEPTDFEASVRVKGNRVLTRHNPRPPVPQEFWRNREHWRATVHQLCEAYRRTCAFSAIRIEPVTGARSVEHFKPKSLYPQLAYEWTNYRLVCSLMNGRKGDHEDVLDPFEIPDRVFDLNPLSGQILVHHKCPPGLRAGAEATLKRLGLDDSLCRQTRREHVEKILRGHWSPDEAASASPFVFQRLREQGLL